MLPDGWLNSTGITFSDLLAVLSILAAIILALWLYRRSLHDRLVEIVYHPVSDLTQALKQNGIDFSVSYSGKAVKTISSLEVLVSNQGKFPINELEIHIYTFPLCELLGSSIQSKEELITTGFTWQQGSQTESGSAKIPYMNPSTDASISFHFSGAPDRIQIEPKTTAEYKAVVKSYDKWISSKTKFQNNTFRALISVGVAFVILSFSIITGKNVQNKPQNKIYYERIPQGDPQEVEGGKKDSVP
jgi:hypothetical protein